MRNLSAHISLALLAFTSAVSESNANSLEGGKSVDQEPQAKWQQVAPLLIMERLQQTPLPRQLSQGHLPHLSATRSLFIPAFPELTQSRADNIGPETLDGALIGFGLGSLMSSGNAQQSVNQEGHREEAAKQERTRKKVESKRSVSRESASKVSGESGTGITASGAGESRRPTRQASENW